MKSNITLSKDDLCQMCENECPENIYDCPEWQRLTSQKKGVYRWVWILK